MTIVIVVSDTCQQGKEV